MVEKIDSLTKFEDDRGQLYLLDLDKIAADKITRSIKVYFGNNTFKIKATTDTFLICVQGDLVLLRDNSHNEYIKLIENKFCQLDNSSYNLTSTADSIFITFTLSCPSMFMNGVKYVNNILTHELNMQNNSIDLSATLNDFDFGVKRLFYIKNVSKGKIRGDHSHSSCSEIMMAVKGQFTLTENNQKEYILNSRENAYLIPANTLTKESCFSGNAICLVLADTTYDPTGYH